ncbi:MAG: ATP phosphoribosyltransferase [Gammaproteobacteria bacterium]|nr:ATP phosphoribosyltransferase [Gammaproteobacteria bacterium]MDH5591880.1 ATP phosphoribosyltransferase [Gammaproteobacteria bacterium]
MPNTLTLALSKGRIFKETLPLLKAAGIEPLDDPETSRKLILATNQPDVQLIIVRASDVPAYVEYGGADIGIAGKDVLLEHPNAELYEPVDLKIACCKLMTAGRENESPITGRIKVATKFVESTRRFYAQQGQQVDIIKLYGSMELAPLVGLADRIVDVVDTGNTLRANGLIPMDHIADISSRLVVNKASMKMKHARIQTFIDQIRSAVEEQNND